MMQLPAAKRFAAGSFCPRGLKMLTRAAVFGTLDARDSGDDRREFMYITYKTAMQLYDLGFHSFWQEHPSRDMVFYKDGICFSLGGNLSAPLTDEEKQLISDGVWLPDQFALQFWLEKNDFAYSISVNQDGHLVECVDLITGTKYTSDSPIPVEDALAANIRKILKHKEREFNTKTHEEMEIYEIIR